MYTDEDLELAIDKGVFTRVSVDEFRSLLSASKNSSAVDEENFRLIGGFNDIFIVIACSLLLFSSLWALNGINASLGFLVFTIFSWILAEFFVLKRKMALPAIALLIAFIGGSFALSTSVFSDGSPASFIVATLVATIAAYFHWRRFKVPITIAVGSAAAVGVLVSVIITLAPGAKDWLMVILPIFGFIVFLFALYWDSSDIHRVTSRSDVAFWLHLLAAPLIVHPVFSSLGVLKGNESFESMTVVVVLYLLMTTISITIDRRVFMVSSLIYVLYALSSLIKMYGVVGYSFALTGFLIGGALLLLSVYWHRVRASLVRKLPVRIRNVIPQINIT